MKRVKVGDICILDPQNKLSISGDYITYAKVVHINGFIYPFRKAICFICDQSGNVTNGNAIPINTAYLIPPGGRGDKYIIRYPEDIPILTKNDYEIVEKVFNSMEDGSTIKAEFGKVCLKIKFFSRLITKY